jgi:trans-aconitate methyltransferase
MTPAQHWNAHDYAVNASFVPELGKPVLDLLTVPPPARVLDLGCGDGVLTGQLTARGYDVLGIDASADMVSAAQLRGVQAQVADGHALPFADATFDAVFSNATLHWLTRPDEVLAGVYRALRPGGQFVGEFGAAGNMRRVLTALLAGLAARGVDGSKVVPWYFPTTADYATRLERAGFRVELITHFDRPTELPGDVVGWVETFGQSFTNALPAEARPAYLRELRSRLENELVNAEGAWVLDYVRLRFRASKP